MEKESKQEGVAEEQVKEETSKPVSEVTSPEEKATSEKPRAEKEFTKMQSLKDKADARAIKAEGDVQSVQNQLQELRNQIERDRLAAQHKQLDALADDPESQRKLMDKFDLDKERREFEAHQEREREGLHVAWQQAASLVAEYNLSPADVPELVDIGNPEHMKDRAGRIAAEKKLKAAEQAKGETKNPPENEESGFTPDSGTSDAGGEDDKTFLKNYSEGKSDDHARAQKLLTKIK